MVVVMRLLAAAKVATSFAISGVCCAAMAPEAAAIMLPEPTPAPMASASGLKMFRLAMKLARMAMNTAAEYGAGDVFRQHAASLRAIHAEALADDGEARLAPHREGGADGFALDAEQQRHRQAEHHGAEEVAELLEHQRPAGRQDLRHRAAHQKAELGDEDEQRRLQEGGGEPLLADRHLQHTWHAGGGKAQGGAAQQRPQQRQQHDLVGAEGEW